jgi:proline iminopeptidase
LALIDPAPITRPARQAFEQQFASRQAGPEVAALKAELQASGLRERDPDAYRQRAFELSVAGYFADPARARDLTPFRVTGRVQQSIWQSLGDYDLRDSLQSVHVPTLVVHGRQDPIPLESSEEAARALGTTCVVIDGSGHVPYVEQPAQLFALLRAFLRDTGSLPSAVS